MNNDIYLDNSATTPVSEEVIEAMLPYWQVEYGNASSLHSFGRRAHIAMEESRARLAASLSASEREIIFTASASEANNLAIKGLAFSGINKYHIITSQIEHPSVGKVCQWLEKQGFTVTYLPVDQEGMVDPDELAATITDDTLLVTIMYGNNEIGTVQPISQIAEICREQGVIFHTDAVQAYGKIPLALENVDMLSATAHKLHGPKGVGMLYLRRGIKLSPLIHGGGHERGLRSGTENIAGIVGFAKAVEIAFAEMEVLRDRLEGFREQLIETITAIPKTKLNGQRKGSLPHITNISFMAIEGESLVMKLDEHGIATSTGSACSSPNLEPSHVLLAIGTPIVMAHGSLRISTGRRTTQEEIDRFLTILPQVVEELREISPFKINT
ncbi:cysteine desulfurase [Candidatus Acetothermia bacterium]|jgi:cysteine desulfurase|nr:cysteine desulfurase [Candidatus Acetothermia bacterium]MCI2427116.1 cysteine desulfurase [Candidatus Acetothermia bacterium]MCI2428464.1 cysteine desulfurase [Candidatus Acetothermia bacterium]